MQVELKKQASRRIDKSIEYCVDNFGEVYAIRFWDKLKLFFVRLADFPEMGFPEPILAHRERFYRAWIVYGHFKIIYYIDEKENKVYIADLWDTRRSPENLAKGFRGK